MAIKGLGSVVKQIAEEVTGAGSTASKAEQVMTRRALRQGSSGNLMGRAKNMGKWMGSNFMSSFEDKSAWGIAKGLGGHALRGGVAGGAIGGTMEAANGGSFWAGAKEGAWNGAVGWTAYRSLGRSVGATTRNPLGRQGPIGAASAMWGATSPRVSKQAVAMINQKQMAGLTRMTMNGANRV